MERRCDEQQGSPALGAQDGGCFGSILSGIARTLLRPDLCARDPQLLRVFRKPGGFQARGVKQTRRAAGEDQYRVRVLSREDDAFDEPVRRGAELEALGQGREPRAVGGRERLGRAPVRAAGRVVVPGQEPALVVPAQRRDVLAIARREPIESSTATR